MTNSIQNVRVLHAFETSILDRHGAGNWKDVTGRRLAFEEVGIAVDQISIGELGSPSFSLAGYTDLVVEYSRSGLKLKQIGIDWPGVRIHVRAHNAEALQEWHRRSMKGNWFSASVKSIYRALGALRQDWRSAKYADNILSISEWDKKRYWSLVGDRRCIYYTPYFCPWPYLDGAAQPKPWSERENTVLSMPGAGDRISLDAIDGFNELATSFKRARLLDVWTFRLSKGAVGLERSDELVRDSNGALEIRSLDDPWANLCRVKAVAILTSLGFGMKTTIIDGLAAGCHVLVDRTLAKRLPKDIRDQCILIDKRVLRHPEKLSARLQEPIAFSDVNRIQADLAVSSIRAALKVNSEAG